MQRASTGLNVFETILARRSVRSYRDEVLDRKTINTLLEAAVRAPTAVHQEPWAFAIVQDRQLLHSLSERAKPLITEEKRRAGMARADHAFDIFASPDFNIFYDAGTLIVICAKPTGHFAAADCWLAAENLMLAACAMGLGTCVIGSALPALDIQELKTQLGIPAEYSAVAPIIVGHPRGETPATSRREPLVLAWR
jgi:nitroreductase